MNDAMHNALMEVSNHELPPLVEFEEAPGLPGVISLGIMPESLRLPKVSDPYCNFPCAHIEFGSRSFGTGSFHFAKFSGLYVPMTLRRMGFARALVYTAQEMADARGVQLYVDAVPFGESTIGISELQAFYRRMGFEPFFGHPFSMVYTPKGAARSA